MTILQAKVWGTSSKRIVPPRYGGQGLLTSKRQLPHPQLPSTISKVPGLNFNSFQNVHTSFAGRPNLHAPRTQNVLPQIGFLQPFAEPIAGGTEFEGVSVVAAVDYSVYDFGWEEVCWFRTSTNWVRGGFH